MSGPTLVSTLQAAPILASVPAPVIVRQDYGPPESAMAPVPQARSMPALSIF